MYLILSEDKTVTTSVAPIHFRVLESFPPSWSQPCKSKPWCHAHSIWCCKREIDGMALRLGTSPRTPPPTLTAHCLNNCSLKPVCFSSDDSIICMFLSVQTQLHSILTFTSYHFFSMHKLTKVCTYCFLVGTE